MLKANNGRANLRVWPLDSITYADRSTSLTRICKVQFYVVHELYRMCVVHWTEAPTPARGCRSADLGTIDRATHMQEWPEGALVNPVDLCNFDSNVAPAIHRVFGTVLVAANDQVATQVLAKYGPLDGCCARNILCCMLATAHVFKFQPPELHVCLDTSVCTRSASLPHR